jgi:membrane protein YdbS with pleckstrin-like domain
MASSKTSEPASGEPLVAIESTSVTTGSAGTVPVFDEILTTGTVPTPKGTDIAAENAVSAQDNADPANGTGVEGEVSIWEARYSKRNFIGRVTWRVIATIAVGYLAYYTWGQNHQDTSVLTWIAISVVGLLWLGLLFRIVQAHYSHYYRLTNRRLFVSTGMLNRRRDMMELLRVKDVFTRQQSLLERWLGLGTVVVVPTEKDLPTFYVAGVDDPKAIMDLIWHHARSERDERSIKVDNV